MDINDLIAMVTEGLSPEQAASVKAAIERDNVKAKVGTLKAQNEYAALVAKEQELQAALDGGPDKPGARAYQQWYTENFAKVQQLQQERTAYEAKFGKLDAAPPSNPQAPPPAATYTEADIQRMVDARIQGSYAPRWSDLLTTTGDLVQRHMFSGRKVPIDFKKLSEIAQTKNGDLSAAYEEWDKPEREKAEKENTEKEIKRRVDEEIQRRGATNLFPAGADFTPSALSVRTKDETDKFDSAALKKDLAKTFMSGTYPES